MPLILTRDRAAFAERVGRFLDERPERNLLATALANAATGAYENPLFCYSLDDTGDVCHASLRTPPWALLTTGLPSRDVAEFVAAWHCEDPAVPGVGAEPATARAVAAEWARLTGVRTHVRMREAMHALSEVRDPPRPARGALRRAQPEDRPLLVQWTREFVLEATHGNVSDAERSVDIRMTSGGFRIWEDGTPVCFLGVTGPINRTVRIGPVYTPPAHRRRGYAGTAVAAASRDALAAGAERCMLFTDVENETSNKIYAEVGYVRFADWEEHAFD